MASLVDQIMELEAKKQSLLAQAKTEALKAAEKAIADLNNLGFHYRLVEVEGDSSTASTGNRSRRTGIAEDILNLVSGIPAGLSRGDIINRLNATDKAAQQSISNALSNLKKKGKLTADNGMYKPA